MLIELDSKERLELASMAYARWSAAYDALKAAKSQTWESVNKFCPKNEWPLYQTEMVQTAQKELILAEKLKAAICPFSPLVIRE